MAVIFISDFFQKIYRSNDLQKEISKIMHKAQHLEGKAIVCLTVLQKVKWTVRKTARDQI